MPDIGYVNPVDDKELKALRGTYETIAKRLEADKAALEEENGMLSQQYAAIVG